MSFNNDNPDPSKNQDHLKFWHCDYCHKGLNARDLHDIIDHKVRCWDCFDKQQAAIGIATPEPIRADPIVSTTEVTCNVCGGAGESKCHQCDGVGSRLRGNSWFICGECNGGKTVTCYDCKGTGKLEAEPIRAEMPSAPKVDASEQIAAMLLRGHRIPGVTPTLPSAPDQTAATLSEVERDLLTDISDVGLGDRWVKHLQNTSYRTFVSLIARGFIQVTADDKLYVATDLGRRALDAKDEA